PRSPSPAPRRATPSRSPLRNRSRSPPLRAPIGPPPPRPAHAPENPDPTNVVGVFGLSIRTTEPELHKVFDDIAPVEKVVIVYDARVRIRSRGFGFITMKDTAAAEKVIKALNGLDLHGRRLRVDFSVTKRPHEPTPGEYRG
ncbi:RNA-binding domain-containing protein, partial [Tilletiopsis washingtonensis]